jgi:hypothetical protein
VTAGIGAAQTAYVVVLQSAAAASLRDATERALPLLEAHGNQREPRQGFTALPSLREPWARVPAEFVRLIDAPTASPEQEEAARILEGLGAPKRLKVATVPPVQPVLSGAKASDHRRSVWLRLHVEFKATRKLLARSGPAHVVVDIEVDGGGGADAALVFEERVLRRLPDWLAATKTFEEEVLRRQIPVRTKFETRAMSHGSVEAFIESPDAAFVALVYEVGGKLPSFFEVEILLRDLSGRKAELVLEMGEAQALAGQLRQALDTARSRTSAKRAAKTGGLPVGKVRLKSVGRTRCVGRTGMTF